MIHLSCLHCFLFIFVLAVAAAKDVEAGVIKAVEAAIASRPSRQGTVFVSSFVYESYDCVCVCAS